MREIKFRLYDEQNKTFIYWDAVNGFPLDRVRGFSLEYIRENTEQFTGLPDKNGKEIYEGDIIVSPNIIKEGAVVKWYNYSWSIGNCWPFAEYDSSYNCFDFEVIGNIHESSFLLDQPCGLVL